MCKTNSFDEITGETETIHNSKWPRILDPTYKWLTVVGSGTEKNITLWTPMTELSNIEKVYLYLKDPFGI